MKIYLRIVLPFLLILIAAILVFLVTWDMPPPTTPIVKEIPDARFQ
tara:strand:+ start:460 stop:597 length:138 start_codon:yes stop_codon:yes gene_type:complete